MGRSQEEICEVLRTEECTLQPNWHILGGSAVFVAASLFLGLSTFAANKEIIFLASLAIIGYLMRQLLQDLEPSRRRDIIGIAIIVFVFRAMPNIGAGASWWQIDVLKFDEAFFGTLRQVASLLAIVGMFALRGWMSRRPIPYLVVFLSVYSTVMMLPFIGMFYGLHEWTEATFGFGARTIAIVDTMADSPLGQVAMIPMLAWIAREAPTGPEGHLFCGHGRFHQSGLVGLQPGNQLPESALHYRTRPIRGTGSVDDYGGTDRARAPGGNGATRQCGQGVN